MLTAGESTRMGSPKALLDWFGKPLIQWQIETLLDAGISDVIVVLGHSHESISKYVSGKNIATVVNHNYKQGKTTSVKAGVQLLKDNARHVLLLSVDQPRPKELISLLIDRHLENNALITAPRFEGHGGHPVIYSIELKDKLKQVSEVNLGVREIMSLYRSEIQWVKVDSSVATLDLNTPEVYQKAKSIFVELLDN